MVKGVHEEPWFDDVYADIVEGYIHKLGNRESGGGVYELWSVGPSVYVVILAEDNLREFRVGVLVESTFDDDYDDFKSERVLDNFMDQYLPQEDYHIYEVYDGGWEDRIDHSVNIIFTYTSVLSASTQDIQVAINQGYSFKESNQVNRQRTPLKEKTIIDRSVKDEVNRDLDTLLKNTHFPSIPLSTIFDTLNKRGLVVLQDDGTTFDGMLAGTEGRALFDVAYADTRDGQFYTPAENVLLTISWHKMETGNYEVIAYLS